MRDQHPGALVRNSILYLAQEVAIPNNSTRGSSQVVENENEEK
jgi:hypothetical protein